MVEPPSHCVEDWGDMEQSNQWTHNEHIDVHEK